MSATLTELAYLTYSPALEIAAADEAAVFDELSNTMQNITRRMAAHYRHAYRPVHAKSHGALVGQLEIGELPTALAQGLFARPGQYPVIFRFSTNPGDLLADTVSSPRGLALKVLNVEGTKVEGHENQTTQDFLCINAEAFSAPGPAGFLKQVKLFEKTLETPEGVKHAVSLAARATNKLLKAIHLPSATLEGIGASATHILGETFSTVAPLRYGNYVAKISIAPHSQNLKDLVGKHIDLGADYNALEKLIQEFFKTETAVWQVRAQLALASANAEDSEFPIEKADHKWPEEKSPWQPVAQIVVAPQNSYSDARQLYVDDRLSFNPFHALEAHRPLGGVMRARRKAYIEAAKYRAERNDRVIAEPKDLTDIPN
jgi:hypothetical protein